MKKREDMIRDIHQRIDEYETDQRAKRAKVRKAFPALAAVTAVVVCLPVGVYAYGLYHKESVKQYLGTQGEELFSEYAVKGTKTFSNDRASVTVDALLYDGYSAYAVMTIEAFDPATIVDWDWSPLPSRFCDADGNPVERDENRRYDGKFIGSISAGGQWDGEAEPSNQGKFYVNFGDMRDWNGETLYMKYEDEAWERELDQETLDAIKNNEYNREYYELLRGLQIEFTFEKNCECYTLTADDGRTVQLSDFEVIVNQEADDTDVNIWEKWHEAPIKLFYKDGTEQEVVNRNFGFVAEDQSAFSIELATSYFLEEDGFTKMFPASEIEAIEINGMRYTK